MSGVNAFSYWLGNYTWDLINAIVIVIVVFLLIAVFQTDGYQGQGLGAVLVLMVQCTDTYVHMCCVYMTHWIQYVQYTAWCRHLTV